MKSIHIITTEGKFIVFKPIAQARIENGVLLFDFGEELLDYAQFQLSNIAGYCVEYDKESE